MVPPRNRPVKIELEDVQEGAYSNFIEPIQNPETKRAYTRNLRLFLNLIPNKIL